MTGRRSGDRNVVGGDRALLDRGYGYLRRGDRYTLDRWLGSQGSGRGGDAPSIHLLNGLLAHWKLGEASGPRVDSLGNSAFSTSSFGVPEEGGVPGLIGNAYKDSTGDHFIAVNDSASWIFPGSYTIAAWRRFDGSPTVTDVGGILNKWATNQQQIFLSYYVLNGGWQFSATSDGTPATQKDCIFVAPLPTIGQWYFVCAWYDHAAHTINLQINNGSITSVSFTGPVFHSNAAAIFAAFFDGASTHHAFGLQDDTLISSRVLNTSERTQLYNGGAGWDFSNFTA